MPIVGSKLVVREAGWSSNSNREDNCGLGDAAHNWLHLSEERRSLATQRENVRATLEVYFKGHAASQGIVLPAEIWVVRARI